MHIYIGLHSNLRMHDGCDGCDLNERNTEFGTESLIYEITRGRLFRLVLPREKSFIRIILASQRSSPRISLLDYHCFLVLIHLIVISALLYDVNYNHGTRCGLERCDHRIPARTHDRCRSIPVANTSIPNMEGFLR